MSAADISHALDRLSRNPARSSQPSTGPVPSPRPGRPSQHAFLGLPARAAVRAFESSTTAVDDVLADSLSIDRQPLAPLLVAR